MNCEEKILLQFVVGKALNSPRLTRLIERARARHVLTHLVMGTIFLVSACVAYICLSWEKLCLAFCFSG